MISTESLRSISRKWWPWARALIRASYISRAWENRAVGGCDAVADIAHIAGLVAAGLHPNPVAHADLVTTTTHKTLRGPRGGMILCREKFAKDVDSQVFPGIQGGPLDARHRGQGGLFPGSAATLVQAIPGTDCARRAKALAEGMKQNGYRLRQRRHGQSRDVGGCRRAEFDG